MKKNIQADLAAGKLFESILGIDYKLAVLIGGFTIIFYTFFFY